MEEVVGELPLDEDIVAALLWRHGPKGEALAAAIACERGQIPVLDPTLVMAAYADAVAWADAHAVVT
jgi:EAL and modified HD-GYP domain-containing signal transduction protein